MKIFLIYAFCVFLTSCQVVKTIENNEISLPYDLIYLNKTGSELSELAMSLADNGLLVKKEYVFKYFGSNLSTYIMTFDEDILKKLGVSTDGVNLSAYIFYKLGEGDQFIKNIKKIDETERFNVFSYEIGKNFKSVFCLEKEKPSEVYFKVTENNYSQYLSYHEIAPQL